MSIVQRIKENPPKEPCLMLLTGPQEVSIVPVGSVLFIVEDPENPEKIIPVVLREVGKGTIKFTCACDNKPACDRKHTYRRSSTGRHPRKQS